MARKKPEPCSRFRLHAVDFGGITQKRPLLRRSRASACATLSASKSVNLAGPFDVTGRAHIPQPWLHPKTFKPCSPNPMRPQWELGGLAFFVWFARTPTSSPSPDPKPQTESPKPINPLSPKPSTLNPKPQTGRKKLLKKTGSEMLTLFLHSPLYEVILICPKTI